MMEGHTVPKLLKSCATARSLSLGQSIHNRVIVSGLSSDPYISSSLLHFYSKCDQTQLARKVFDAMPTKNVVAWTSIIAAYSRSNDPGMAFSMYDHMRARGVLPNSITLLSLLLPSPPRFINVQCVHACAVRTGFAGSLVVVNSMLNAYAKSGNVDVSRALFDEMRCFRDVVSWNCVVSGYAWCGNLKESMSLVKLMMGIGGESVKPDAQTFTSLLSGVSDHGELKLGKSVHAQILVSGLRPDRHVETALLGMYLNCGSTDDALLVFDGMLDADAVSWTAMISGLVQNFRVNDALIVFRKLLASGALVNSIETFASVLAACAQMGLFLMGASIHCYIIRHKISVDLSVQNSLVTMYAKCGRLDVGRAIFNRMHIRNSVSWNAMLSGYARNGCLNEAFSLFDEMRMTTQIPDSISIVLVLQACASVGVLQHGKWVHGFIVRSGIIMRCISVDTALIDMYSKCGDLQKAWKCFDEMPEKDMVSWSAIIAGHGGHGHGEVALKIYQDFLATGLKPNSVIFLSVLSACSHSGMVSQGLQIFQSMTEEFGIKPALEHCGCVVDLLSRSGRVSEAETFVRWMLPNPNADVLGILLEACKMYGYERLHREITRQVTELKPKTAENYVQLAQSYAALNLWEGVGETWAMMRTLGLKKTPGWSFIELLGTITPFFVNDSSHPSYEEIVSVLKLLEWEYR
ncbi:Pentatricopeptide repeat-containing protein [Acorus gramineus]|uniref:Pentatricopeptide repeat-containing protein n=1 Tax=Acorus gramineus TaxID=55184 RepID=A0AAV9BIY1_ACOGR|nr:Pentatricopeptide repeat-containing protein [Acorus gramineus]